MAEKLTDRDENIICGVIVGSYLDNADKTRLCDLVRGLNAVDEEMTPHAFVALTASPDEDWCTDCEYHRDHAVHKAPTALSGVEALIAKLVETWRMRAKGCHAMHLNPQATLLNACADELATALKGSK